VQITIHVRCRQSKCTISIAKPLVEHRHPAGVPTHYAFLSPLLSSAGASSLTVFGGDGTQQHLSSTILLAMSSFCKEFQVVLLMLHVIFRCSMFASANVVHCGAAAGINQSSQSSLSAFFLLNNSLARCK